MADEDTFESTKTEDQFESHGSDPIPPDEFVELLKKYPEALNRSHRPSARALKMRSLENIRLDFFTVYGKEVSIRAISKKMSNLKCRLGAILNDRKRGKKTGKFRPWEIEFLKLVGNDLNYDCDTIIDLQETAEGEAEIDIQSDDSARMETPEPRLYQHQVKKERISINKEKDDTRNLSNDELQRLVLLEQLQLYRLKKEADETKNLSNHELQRLVLLEQLQVFRLKKEKLSMEIEQFKRVVIDTDY